MLPLHTARSALRHSFASNPIRWPGILTPLYPARSQRRLRASCQWRSMVWEWQSAVGLLD